MKIPYTVSSNTRQAYKTSKLMKNSPREVNRKIVAEDFEWDENVTPAPLTYFAALALSRIFHRINPLRSILQKDINILMDLYPADIPLNLSVPLIKDEQYWKRSYRSKFGKDGESGESTLWKKKYLSAFLQEYLENANPDVFIEEDAAELASLVSPYIFKLSLKQLKMVRQPLPILPFDNDVEDTCPFSVTKIYHHIPLQTTLEKLYNLQEISLIFGINNLQDGYLPRFFEFSHEDCESLCRGLKSLRHLKIFRINRSNLDSSKTKLILQNLVKIETIEELDFNHCKIGDYGMKALAGFIMVHKNLRKVRVANNRFNEVGVQGISYALQMKPAAPIELLDFSLNSMSLECATILAAALVRCKKKPQTLIVNSCNFHGASAEKIVGLLSLNRGLIRLDLAANNLSGAAEKKLIEALEKNKKLLKLDLCRTCISDETQAKVDELLERNEGLRHVELEPSDEIPPLFLNDPEYLVWEYNPNNPEYIPGKYPERVPEV